jgi:bifunctional enzyme CysN/CysC
VDDGKSTLIGRLLYDSKRLFDDQLAALAADSRRHGTQAKRSTTRCCSTAWRRARAGHHDRRGVPLLRHGRRKFIVADCPGHEQYTRNMATGASTADLAVVLVDARKGCCRRRAGTATSPRCSACATWCWR